MATAPAQRRTAGRQLSRWLMRAIWRLHPFLYRRGMARGFRGAPIILLTTRGRKSGLLVTSPLVSVRDGEAFIVIASAGGADKHPAWWLNLLANPEAVVQAGNASMKVCMEEVTDQAERDRLWKRMTAVVPGYNAYQRRTARLIPLALLRPSSRD